MSMQRFRVGVGHRVERTAWRYPNADAVARPSRNHCPNHFKKKTAAVFNRATILVGSFVAAILKELVNQITVPRVHFDAVEACCFRTLDGFAKLIQNARNLRFFKSTVRRGLYPTHRSRHETRRVLPVSGIHGRRNGRRSLRERDVRETPWMPQLRKDTPTLRGSLTVVFQHEIARNTVRLLGTRARKRSHHDSMFQASRADFNRTE